MRTTNLFQQLQSCSGPLAELLCEVNRDCACTRRQEAEAAASSRVGQLLEVLGGRDGALAVLAAYGQSRWPASYGQSPYEDIARVMRCAVLGVELPRGASVGMREIHAAVFERLAPPAAVSRHRLCEVDRARRYRRLLRAMQHAALLTPGEADSALRVLLRYHPQDRNTSPPGCEAVAHFGGNAATVRAARRWRLRFAASRLLEAA